MKRPPAREDARLWAIVAATVRPLPGRVAPRPVKDGGASFVATRLIAACTGPRPSPSPLRHPQVSASGVPPPIEPNRRRRLDLGGEALTARLDLHGLSQDAARARLTAFIQRRSAEGGRAILVITGKGLRNEGLLRRRVPEWLAEPPLRDLVSGLSEAHPRRGGAGALYIVLRRQRG